MKISTFVLSFIGFCIFYICNADWIDELYERLIEDYLGGEYEEVAPFISSVTAGTEEFDQLIEEFARSKRKWYQTPTILPFLLIGLIFSGLLYHIVVLSNGRAGILKAGHDFLGSFCKCRNSPKTNEEDIQNLVLQFLETKFKHLAGGKGVADDVPVQLLWKGGTLFESSVHCNIREESADSKVVHMQKHLLQSKLLLKCADMGGGDEKCQVSPASSDETTALKMAEIRKMLESEQEIRSFLTGKEETVEEARPGRTFTGASDSPQCRQQANKITNFHSFRRSDSKSNHDAETSVKDGQMEFNRLEPLTESTEFKPDRCDNTKPETMVKAEADAEGPDPKLMNRIRLLENRLRIEELKNKNWINRMSRAEGILQQLNKQVERIEEARPMRTHTETLKITSTVTNWASSVQPRRNTQFTLVNQYRPFCGQTPSMSLSEIIKREIGFPSPSRECSKTVFPNSQVSVSMSPYPSLMQQSSILSKFLSR